MAKPANNLVWAILSTLFCCIPAGVVSIVYAARVDGAWNRGEYAVAKDASDKARTWAIVSAGVGLVLGVAWFIFVASAGNGFNNP
jgi:hypothetical protein